MYQIRKFRLGVFLAVVCSVFAALSGVCVANDAALKFNGTSNRVDIATALVSEDITMSAWVKADTPWVNDTRVVISNSYWGAAANRVGFHLSLQNSAIPVSRYQTQADGVGVWSATGKTSVAGSWHHVAYVKEGTKISIVVDGVEEGSRNDVPASIAGLSVSNMIRIGCNTSNARFVPGIIDEVRIWNHALSVSQIQESMGHELRGTEAGLVGYWRFDEGQGTTVFDSSSIPHNGTIVGATWTTDTAPVLPGLAPLFAYRPFPSSGTADVPRDVVLSWKPGGYAGTHDVYLGTSSADVDAASRSDSKGVLVSQAHDANTYDPPGVLEYGKTYYWRVDEVNAPPSDAIFKGSVWSFSVEPFGYRVTPVKATASSSQPGLGPEKTIDNSGMTGDRHGTDDAAMWVSAGTAPNWIQYEFDDVYKLYEMTVWNSNQMLESILGFGAKDVTVETSTDGQAWTAVPDVPEFARAPGAASYAANTIVNFGGAVARYVKLTINSTWGGLPAAGLSEVRFSFIPVRARLPQPASGATNVDVDVRLDWRPGREAASHRVFFGVDADAVAGGSVSAQVVADHGYDPGPLNFGTTYFWKVDEVNDAMDPALYEGLVWSFTTREYEVIDDIESYTDEEGSRIYETWVDGLTSGTNGSLVGYMEAPFAERTIVHGGKQSMPFEYRNAEAPFYSEAEQEFVPAQNWTTHGADTLSLWVRGAPAAFVESGGTITMSAAGTDIWGTADDFRYAFKTLTGDGSIVVKVESLVNTNVWAKAGVMIRQSLDEDSKFVYFIQSFGSGVSLGWRATTAAAAASIPATAGVTAPQWVKLTRKGDVFTAQYSADGTTWTDLKAADGTVGSTTVVMSNPVYVGLCVTSHNVAATTTAVMSGVSITGNVTGASWQVQAIGNDPQPANSPTSVYVTVQDSTNKTATATNATAATSAEWTQWKIPFSSLTGVNLKSVKKLYLGAGSKSNPVQGGGGILYIDDIAFGRPVGGQ